MTTLVAGTMFSSREPTLLVENKLDPGAWTFRLVAVDDDGNESAPRDLTVSVIRAVIPTPGPTPIPHPVDPHLVTPVNPIDPHILTPVTPVTAAQPVDPHVVTPVTPAHPIDPDIITRRPG